MNDVWYMVCIDPKQISAKLMMWCILCTGSFFNLPLWPYYNVTRRNVFHLIHLRCDSFINVKIALDSQNLSLKHSIKFQRHNAMILLSHAILWFNKIKFSPIDNGSKNLTYNFMHHFCHHSQSALLIKSMSN